MTSRHRLEALTTPLSLRPMDLFDFCNEEAKMEDPPQSGRLSTLFFWGGVVGWLILGELFIFLHFSVGFFWVGWLNVLGWEIEKSMVELRTIIAKPERLGEFLM